MKERKELHMIQSVPPHLIVWACIAASGTGSLAFIDDVTKCCRMNSEVYRAYIIYNWGNI